MGMPGGKKSCEKYFRRLIEHRGVGALRILRGIPENLFSKKFWAAS